MTILSINCKTYIKVDSPEAYHLTLVFLLPVW